MARTLKVVLSLILAVACLATGLVPDVFGAALVQSMQAHAEADKAADDAQPVTGELTSGGWRYRVCADGYIELLGYTDASATTLTLPAALEGAWVVRIAENGFAENAALSDVTIPAQISEIPDSAFSHNASLTIHAYNGTAALLFANKRGFVQDNRSEFDFFEDILDLSEMKSAQWSLSGSSVTFEAPYSRMLRAGMKVYLPRKGELTNGLPVRIVSCADGTASYEELNFADAIRSFDVQNVQLTPDVENIQILAEGVELDPTTARGTITGSFSAPLKFNLKFKVNERMSVSGSFSYTPSMSVSLDYGFFKLNELAYESKVAISYEMKITGKTQKILAQSIKLARVPMVSGSLVRLWLELTLEVNPEGEITVKGTMETSEKVSLKNGKVTKSKNVSNKPINLSAAVSLKAELKGAIAMYLGFESVKTNVKVAELAVSYGWKFSAETSTEAVPACVDLTYSQTFKVTLEAGILEAKVAGKEIRTTKIFGGEVFNETHERAKLHFEYALGKFVSECTRSRYATVSYYIGPNDQKADCMTITVNKGVVLSKPSNPSRSGYTFEGWYKDDKFKTLWDFANDKVTEDVTLYAKWISNATGATVTPAPEEPEDEGPISDSSRLLTAAESMPYLKYEITGDGVEITGYNGRPIALTIPDEIEGKKVVSIKERAFKGCKTLKQIVLPDGITTMGECAFQGTYLTSVRTPASWTKVVSSAPVVGDVALMSPFAGCTTLKSVAVPQGVTMVPDYAFNGSAEDECPTASITSVSLPDTLTEIGVYAFGETGISSIVLPDSITAMGSFAFAGSHLSFVRTPVSWTETIPYKRLNTYYASPFEDCEMLKSAVVPEGVKVLPHSAFDFAKNLVDISLPSTLEEIGNNAFCATSISSIKLPDGLKVIGMEAFAECDNLKSIVLPDSITTMGTNAFAYTGLTSVRTPLSWTDIISPEYDDGAYCHSPFDCCDDLKTIVVPEGVTKLPDCAFHSNPIEGWIPDVDVRLPSTLEEIGACAFSSSGISSIRLPEGLKVIGASAFEDCGWLTDINLPDSITTIGAYAFFWTSLTTVRTPLNWTKVTQGIHEYEGVSRKTGSPFEGCQTLKNVIVPEGVTVLPDNAFNFKEQNPFALNVREYGDMTISLPSTLTKVGENAFAGTNFSEIVLPKSVAAIGARAMASCTSLKRVVFMGDVQSMGEAVLEDTPVEQICAPSSGSSVRSYLEKNYPDVRLFGLPSDYHVLSWQNTGDAALPDQTVQAGMKITRPAEPSYAEHTFGGWYSDAACTQAWDFEKDVMPDGNLTLYARWLYTPAGFSYTIADGRATITKYEGSAVNLVIPDEIGGAAVGALAAESIPDSVARLTIPAGVAEIDAKAFRYAGGLTSIAVAAGNAVYRSEDGVLYRGDTLICYPQSRAGEKFTVPDGVSAIGERGFYDCDILRALTIPAGVGSLGEYGVYDCDNLTSVAFAADVNAIADGNFLLCANDLNVTGPIGAEKLTAYADGAYVNYNMYNLIYVQGGAAIASSSLRAGERIGELPALEAEGEKAFLGWSTTEDSGSLWTAGDTLMPESDMVFYAVFGYLFEYEAAEGGVILTKYTGAETRVKVPMSIDGQKVVGIRADCFEDKSVTLLGDGGTLVEDFAGACGLSFERIAYRLSFETNGGTKAAARELCAGDEIILPTPVRQGYALNGWYTNAALTEAWTAGDPMPAGDLTLYARWKRTDETAVSIPFTFEETEGGLTITGFTGEFGKVEIPESINGQTVVGIADYAFEGNAYMQVVSVPASVVSIGENAFADSTLYSITMAGVKTIGAHAFEGCAALAEVALPDTLTALGAYAFQDCSALLNIELPQSVVALSEGLFSGCEWLVSVGLPAGLETIGAGAFRGCVRIAAIDVGANVSEISPDAFEGCNALAAFSAADGNMYYKAVDGVLFNKAGTQLMAYPAGRADSIYAIPGGVTMIAANAMRSSRITELRLNDELTAIGEGALSGSMLLETIAFNKKLTDIGANAFEGCANLREVTIPDSVGKIGAEAFDMTGLTRIYIPPQTELGRNAVPALDGLTIYGQADSEAEIYAEAQGIRFIDSSRDIEVTGISIPETLSIQPETTAALTAMLEPSDTTERRVLWSSADETVAAVTEDGVVQARSIGTTVITAKAANGSTAECTVTVAKEKITAESIALSAAEINLLVGEMRAVSATVLPNNADDGAVSWSVEDPEIVSWINGSLVGMAVGQTVLTATTAGGLKAQCTITVKPGPMGRPDFELPQVLKAIAPEAFTGLAMRIVLCPDGLETIGARAFAGCEALRQIYIPASVAEIAADAFADCSRFLVIYGEEGSAAERFADENGYAFSSKR